MSIEALRTALHSHTLEQLWSSCLENYTEGTPQDRVELATWIMAERDAFLRRAADVDDEEELVVMAALGYIELKSKWQMFNTQINYQVFRKGEAESALTFKSSLLSTLVDTIGSFLTEDDLRKIQEFLLSPTTTALVL
jgi:hypothetical protein